MRTENQKGVLLLSRQIAVLTALVLCGPALVRCSPANAAVLDFERSPAQSFTRETDPNCVEYSALVYDPAATQHPRQVNAGSLLPMRFDRTGYDDGGFWNPNRPAHLRVPTAGLYAVRLRINFEVREPNLFSSPPERRLVFAVDGTATRGYQYDDPYHTRGYWPTLERETLFSLTAGQAITAHTTRTDASPQELLASGVELSIRRICVSGDDSPGRAEDHP